MNFSLSNSPAIKVGLKPTASDSNVNNVQTALHILPPLYFSIVSLLIYIQLDQFFGKICSILPSLKKIFSEKATSSLQNCQHLGLGL